MYDVSVHDDSGYELVNSGTTSIYPLNGWFGGDGLSSSGTIVNVSPLGSQPAWEGTTDDDDSSVPKTGVNSDIPNKYRGYEGIIALKNIIKDKSKTTKEISIALHDLYSMLRTDYKNNKYGERDNFYSIANNLMSKENYDIKYDAMKYMMSWKILDKDYTNAIVLAKTILDEFPGNDSFEIQLSLIKLYILTGDKNNAELLLSSLNNRYEWANKFILDLAYELESMGNNSANGNKIVNERNESITDNKICVNKYGLNDSYPNPFNPITNISYSLPEKSLVSIRIFDILGKEVAQLVNSYKESGTYTVEFEGSNLASGMYIVSMQAGKFKQSKKVLLMK